MKNNFNKKVLREAAKPKKLTVGSATLESRKSTLENVLDNMDIGSRVGIFLAGSTGIGKTTFVKQLGKLLGMNVILVEAPHATEEHLVNIPFVVFNTRTNAQDVQTFGVELAQSQLAAELAAQKIIPDAQYLRSIKNWDANTKALWQSLGGTDTEIPEQIREARAKFKTILFLDEYQRQVSGNVRNMLRNILNGRIGNDRIPRGSYVIYASNLSDVGNTVEPMNLNQQFDQIEFQAPNKADFFHYLTSAFEKDKIELKPEVAKTFYSALKDEHISYDDSSTEIRTSPRRWEQLISYVNAAVPVKSKEEAGALLANVQANFQDIEKVSTIHAMVEKIVRKIIEQTSGEEFSNSRANNPTEWRDTFKHQIEMAEKMGDTRKYVPVVNGQPGIGKTAMAAQVADDLNLRLVAIDCANLTQEEITGIPIPKKEGEKMSVQFSEPALYKRIMQDIHEADQEFFADPNVSQETKDAYKNKKYKYLILFDELNRPKSQAVFNSLRRVILEKSFTDTVKLPENAIVVAAMNPTDSGTQPLTGHLKDAIDQIDTSPSWPQTLAYLKNLGNKLEKTRDPGAVSTSMEIVEAFADHFGMKTSPKKPEREINQDSLKFYIKIGDADAVYISPREYTQMFQNLCVGLNRVFGKSYEDETQLIAAIIKMAHEKIMMTLRNVLFKQDTDSTVFSEDLTDLLNSLGATLLKKQTTTASLESLLDEVVSNPDRHLATNLDFDNYMVNNFEPNSFTEQLEKYLNSILESEKTKWDAIFKQELNDKTLQGDKVVIETELVDRISFVINEIMMAVKSFNLSGDVNEAVSKAVTNSVDGLLADADAPDELMNKTQEWYMNLRQRHGLGG